MRILVTGATGYIGSRAVPALLDAGHDVRAAFTSPDKAPTFWWSTHPRVEVQEFDVFDADSVRAAVAGVDGVLYLIHSMDGDDFAEKDDQAASTMAEEGAAAGVSKFVYVSGIVPDVDESELSEHITSRLSVERTLADSGVPTITLRAAVIMGSASTSFEIIRQISERLPVHAVPEWMDSTVQPIAVTDVTAAIVGAFAHDGPSHAYDVGGPTALPYADLLQTYCEVAGIKRSQVSLPGVSSDVVGVLAGSITDVDSATVEALIDSLHHDMVAADDDFVEDLLPGGHELVDLEESIRRSLAAPDLEADPANRDPLGPMPYDPDWAGSSHGGLDTAKAAVKAVASSIAQRLPSSS